MRTDLEREDFVQLLEKLRNEDDADILAAVRDINAKMTVADVTWDDLLISQSDDEGQGSGESSSNTSLDDDDDEDLAPLGDEEKQEATRLISEIGNMEISDTTKQELEEYTDDIEQGEFELMDLRYLRALKARLVA